MADKQRVITIGIGNWLPMLWFSIAFQDYFKTDTGDPADLYWNPPQGEDDYLRSASSFAAKWKEKGFTDQSPGTTRASAKEATRTF